jgi:hypothetical protein
VIIGRLKEYLDTLKETATKKIGKTVSSSGHINGNKKSSKLDGRKRSLVVVSKSQTLVNEDQPSLIGGLIGTDR